MKAYIKPSIEVNVIAVEHALMAGSVTTDSNGNVESVSGGGDYEGGAILGNESGSVWGDED